MTDTYSKAAVGYERIQEILQTDDEVRDLRGAKAVEVQRQDRIRPCVLRVCA